jgi:UDP-3-O-[3-hydroxymyristoyl] N-acetylglucosamine deacetylase
VGRRTIGRAVSVAGIGLHGGQPVQVELRPAAPGAGRRFTQAGRSPIPATLAHVCDAHLATRLAGDGWTVRTVEHLLAAAFALDIDDLEIQVIGDELPILDGSAQGWLAALDRAGRVEQPGRPTRFRVRAPVTVRDGERWARLEPHDGLELQAEVCFDHPAVGQQQVAFDGTADAFRRDIAPARTFGFETDIAALQAAGLARGGSLDNAVVFGEDGPLNPGGLRFSDEPARHKLLDLCGDLALLGGRLCGRLTTSRPGHALTHGLLRAAIAHGTKSGTGARGPDPGPHLAARVD